MKPIEKTWFESTMREIRKLYQRHARGEILASTFEGQSAKLLRQLKWKHVRSIVDDTGAHVISELEAHQRQFGLSLEFETTLYYDRGVKAAVRISMDRCVFGEIFIGPRFCWNTIAVHEGDEEGGWFGPNLYTKRMAKRWKPVNEFDFPAYLQQLKEHIDDYRAEEEKRAKRRAAGLPEDDRDVIPF